MRLFRIGIFLFVLLTAAVLGIRIVRDSLIEKALEVWLNATQAAFFGGSIDLRGVHLDKNLKIGIQELTGSWQTSESSLPIKVQDIRLEDPLTHFVLAQSVRIRFDRFRPRGFEGPGVRGEVIFRNDKAGTFELKAQFLGLDLASLTPLDPENLKDASGQLTGDFYLARGAVGGSGSEAFSLDLKVAEPGGRLQARFFDLLAPYFPTADRSALAAIRGTQRVSYREADLKIKRADPKTVNLLLHILVPDYNLNLNLNVIVSVEDKDAFLQLAGILGLIRVGKR